MAMVQLISRDLVLTKQQDAWIERMDSFNLVIRIDMMVYWCIPSLIIAIFPWLIAEVPDVKQYSFLPLNRLMDVTQMFKLDKESTDIITNAIINNWKVRVIKLLLLASRWCLLINLQILRHYDLLVQWFNYDRK
jgi:hypothetical protein